MGSEGGGSSERGVAGGGSGWDSRFEVKDTGGGGLVQKRRRGEGRERSLVHRWSVQKLEVCRRQRGLWESPLSCTGLFYHAQAHGAFFKEGFKKLHYYYYYY